jgi:hypothetical protein
MLNRKEHEVFIVPLNYWLSDNYHDSQLEINKMMFLQDLIEQCKLRIRDLDGRNLTVFDRNGGEDMSRVATQGPRP